VALEKAVILVTVGGLAVEMAVVVELQVILPTVVMVLVGDTLDLVVVVLVSMVGLMVELGVTMDGMIVCTV
jgi:hypothetical protein